MLGPLERVHFRDCWSLSLWPSQVPADKDWMDQVSISMYFVFWEYVWHRFLDFSVLIICRSVRLFSQRGSLNPGSLGNLPIGLPFYPVFACNVFVRMQSAYLLSVSVLWIKQFIDETLEVGESVAVYNFIVHLLCLLFFCLL